jgi:ABC-2 type transport system ATP-binding protein
MIEVKDLVKRFGETEAVSHVSFTVGRGEIVGFLGPNGAGKSTTLRVLTGFLPPTSGEVFIGGHASGDDGKAVRKLIGYLPENNPLYEDLRVREYLRFRASLKGVPRKERSAQVEKALEVCEVNEVADRIIGTCSKGYRQRVGLADVLLGNPPVLILDEPTVGLDPAQIVHTRNLIKTLSEDHTVILSTHILPEVEAICSKVLIIHQGKLLFDGSVSELKRGLRGAGHLLCAVQGERAAAEACLAGVPGVEGVDFLEAQGDVHRFQVTSASGEDLRGAIFKACAERGLVLLEMTAKHVSLEEAFLSITTTEVQTPQARKGIEPQQEDQP